MKNMNTKVNFAGIEMKNPVTVASGTFGYGREYADFFDLGKLGAIITKGFFDLNNSCIVKIFQEKKLKALG